LRGARGGQKRQLVSNQPQKYQIIACVTYLNINLVPKYAT
jgi:hypothetical protein